MPVGLAANGLPAGVWLYAGFLQEPKLLAISYAIEQLLQPRSLPEFRGSVPPEPPDAGICDDPKKPRPRVHTMAGERRRMRMHPGSW